MKIEYWGLIDYRTAWNKQKEIFHYAIDNNMAEDTIVVCEHMPVYTVGFHGNISNMKASEEYLKNIGIECIRIERGGDVTFHGQGQLVVYPIVNLKRLGIGVKRYVEILQDSVMELLSNYNIVTSLDPSAPGVWIDSGKINQRKICALGVKVSHGITMHGLALNVNTDLKYFSLINPCGFTDRGVTSMQKELNIENLDFKKISCELALILKNKLIATKKI